MRIVPLTRTDPDLAALRRRLRQAEIDAEKARIRRRLRQLEAEGVGLAPWPAALLPWRRPPALRPMPLDLGAVLRRIAAAR